MKLKALLVAAGPLFLIGCTTPAENGSMQSYQHTTYVGCKAKFGNSEPIENAATIDDLGDSFIVKGTGGEFYSGKLVLRTDRFVSSEPSGGMVFSKGVDSFSKVYIVHLIKDNIVSVFDCTSAIAKN